MNVVALGTSNRGEILTQQAIHRAADITRLVQCREPLSRDLDDNTLKRLKAELGWYSCAQYNPAHRAKANIAGPLHLLSFDVDEGTLPDLSAYSGVVIETATSAPGAQRWRVHLDLAEPVPVELYTSVLEAFCSTHNVPIDEGAKDPSRLWYRRVQRVTFLDGAPLDWRLLFGELKPKSKAETLAAHGITPEGWTVDDVREALLALKPKDGDREMWRNVTWGFKAAGGDRETWLRWCDTLPGQDKNLKARTNDARVWDDDKGEGITSLTFTKAAREAGFVPRAERPEIILADFPIVPIEQLTRQRSFSVVRGDDFASSAPIAWLVKRWIPKSDEPIGIYGDSGVGKTSLALDLALAIARGEPWHGHKTKRGRVVWIAAENPSGLRTRLAAYKQHHGCDLPLEVVPHVPRFDKPTAVEELAADIGPADAIFIDHLTSVKGQADLNSDMATLMNGAKQLNVLTGATVVLLHHEGKNAAAGAKGGSEFRAFAQTLLHVELGSRTNTGKVTILKQRDERKGERFWFALDFVQVGTDEDGEPFGACVVKPTVSQVTPPKDLGDLQLEIWNETAARSEEGITLDGLRAGIVVVGKKPAKQLNAALARLLEHKEGRFTQDGERYYADRIFANSEVGT